MRKLEHYGREDLYHVLSVLKDHLKTCDYEGEKWQEFLKSYYMVRESLMNQTELYYQDKMKE